MASAAEDPPSATGNVAITDNDAYFMCLLMLKDEASKEELQVALSTLLKIMRNIQQNPHDEKFRKVKKSNKAVQQKVWRFGGAQQFLYAAGWIDVDDTIVLTGDTDISGAVKALESQLSQVSPSPGASTSPTVNGAPPQEQGSWSQRELTEKEKQIAEDRKRQLQKMKRDKEERKRISDQIKADRREANTREVKESHARHLESDGGMKRFDDIGINLNKGGG